MALPIAIRTPGSTPRASSAPSARRGEGFRDTSIVWAKAVASATSSTNPEFVKADAVAWLRLDVVGTQVGPTGGDRLTETTFIQRLNTVGGVAASTGCSSANEIGTQAFVPYSADYFFFKREDK